MGQSERHLLACCSNILHVSVSSGVNAKPLWVVVWHCNMLSRVVALLETPSSFPTHSGDEDNASKRCGCPELTASYRQSLRRKIPVKLRHELYSVIAGPLEDAGLQVQREENKSQALHALHHFRSRQRTCHVACTSIATFTMCISGNRAHSHGNGHRSGTRDQQR